MLIIVLLLLLVFFLWIQSRTVRFVKAPQDGDSGYDVLTCLDEFEVRHALDLVENKKYRELQHAIQNNPRVLREIEGVLGSDYVFQDYMLSLEKSAISTCHRDENGQMFNDRVVHPTYTMLFFLEPMDSCLDVIAGSHRRGDFINVSQPLESVSCDPGQAILFNADLIHSGSINDSEDNHRRVQMKLIHKDDVGKIPQFDDYHKVVDASKSNSRWYTTFVRNASCTFTGVADAFKNGENAPDFMKKVYKVIAYGGDDRYKLHNV
jgi:hypothetical protein